jgi:transposase-like protein
VKARVWKDGYREILGAQNAACKNETFWSGLFDEMKKQGLNGVQLVISDGQLGIQKAVPSRPLVMKVISIVQLPICF